MMIDTRTKIPDTYAFTMRVNDALAARRITWTDAAAEIGCKPHDLMLVCGGGRPKDELRLAILRWLEYRREVPNAAE
jgi:hypothetical protein